MEQHILSNTYRATHIEQHISSNTYRATHIEQYIWNMEQHISSNTHDDEYINISSNTYNKCILGTARVTQKITYHRSSSSYCVGAASVSGMFARASSDGIDCSIAGDECIYAWYALLLHRPKILMSHSGIPAAAAVVAAPLLKLWLEYC